jgi:phospho-N-acetylmuramoyl-pentapeptide-transferase
MGTPTMGGVLIWGTVLAVTLFTTLTLYRDNGRSILFPLFVLVASGTLGLIDDRMSLVRTRGGQGMRARFKFVWQIGIAAVAAAGLFAVLGIDHVFVPTVREALHLGGVAYCLLVVLTIVGAANAVNLTDGLDGLAGTTAAWSFGAYAAIAYLYGQFFLVTFCLVMMGALLAFLWFNAHPAEVFMGDTGSLAVGATLAVVALMTGQVLLLPIIGFIFVAEALSVILQVGYFKLTGGKRLLRMSPLHHHFELMGWSETQITQRFWLISILASLLGIALALV